VEKFKLTVTEIRKGTFEVEAETREEAIAKFEEEYFKNPIEYDPLLDVDDTTIE